MSLFERERRQLAVHGTAFVHGFRLPFSLIVATLRDAELRGPYLRVALLRGLLLAVIGSFAIASGSISSRGSEPATRGIVIGSSKHATATEGEAAAKAQGKTMPVHVDIPGLHVHIDPDHGKSKVSVLGQDVPVTRVEDGALGHAEQETAVRPSPEPRPWFAFVRRVWTSVRESWTWLLALLAFLSVVEVVIVFFSRRWDDWLSFHAARLARVRPEEETPKAPGISFDLKWVYRKAKRRLRGYVVFAAGLPALLPLRFLPWVGPWAFPIAATLWGWYWLGIFSAAKSAHAWADESTAPSPLPIRELSRRVSQGTLRAPFRVYARLWARLTSGVNPAAATFERSAPAFLGLALARAILSLPGLYFLARPIVPLAAGRLCAESDPAGRFSA